VASALDRIISNGEAAGVMTPKRERLLKRWASHPWAFLKGKDEDGRPVVTTVDPHDTRTPVKPFPTGKDWDYLRLLVRLFHSDEAVIGINKPRQILATWTALLVSSWECMFVDYRLWLLSKSTQTEANAMLKEKVVQTYGRMPEWLRECIPMKAKASELSYHDGNSRFVAVASNVYVRQARGFTPTGMIIDEAAFQPSVRDIVAAVAPATKKLWIITTPDFGTPGADYCGEVFGASARTGTG